MSQSRREFLKSMLGTASFLSLAPAVPAFLQRAAWASPQDSSRGDSILVVLQLSGGNDGLNTVVPYADDAYGRNRDTLRLDARDVITLDTYLGLHPQLTSFKRLLDSSQLTIVQGVGYPRSDRDHDRAMNQWHTARPDELNCQTGWIGRAVDAQQGGSSSVPAAFVGPIEQPFALRAERSVVPSVRDLSDLIPAGGSAQAFGDPAVVAAGATTRSAGDNPLLATLQQATVTAQQMGAKVETVLSEGKSTAEYPSFTLAGQLQMVAQLIRAELGVRIFLVELGGGGIGGFDNHANQRDNHAALLRELSESIAAFCGDLERQNLLSRVLLMTFSEFGRTVTENGRRGTDHGAAAPVFLAGGGLRGGILGDHPSLTDLEQDALKFHIDYRRVYSTVLGQWLGYDADAILGARYETLDIV